MKSRFLLFLLLIIVTTSSGQIIFLKFGPSFSKIANKSRGDFTPYELGIMGFDVLAGVNYLNYKYFNLSSGVGFIQEEVGEVIHHGETESPGSHTDIALMKFLTINTTFNLKIPIKKIIEPYISVGPKLDYQISYSDPHNIFDDQLNKVIFGILFSGGINFIVKRFQLGLVFDYYLNLKKFALYYLNYSNHPPTKEKVSVNTFTTNVCIGFKF